MKITHIGHGSNLIELAGAHFLTDPNFSERMLGFKRRRAPGLDPAALPPLAAILVSHAHYDHLDIFSYKYFKTTIPVIVPKGLGNFFSKFLPHPVIEIPPGNYHRHHDVEIHALPVKHHGSRWIPLRNRAAAAYVLKAPDGTVYFAGDSGYGEHFRRAGEAFDIDTALLPVGGYQPRWWLKNQKMTPEEALQAMEDLKAKRMIPIDWGVFNSFGENPDETEHRLEAAIAAKKLAKRVHVLQPGQSLTLETD